MVIPSNIEEPHRITSPHHRGLLRVRFASLRMTSSANPAAAEDNVTVVNDCSLSGRYGTLRIVQSHMGAIIPEWRDSRKCSGMIVADFDNSFERTAIGARGYSAVARVAALGSRMPVHTIDLELFADQIAGIANDDTICRRIEVDDITRTRRTAGQPLSLTDREQLDPVMFTDKIPLNVINVAAVKFVIAQMGTQKRLVIVAGNKANFLAVDLVGDLEA